MALTPDDVLQKRFETTRFRDGYDQDEVDDFLDEVVAELKRLGDENEQLRSGTAAATAAPAAAEVDTAELDKLRAENEALRQQVSDLQAQAESSAAERSAAAEVQEQVSTDTGAQPEQQVDAPQAGVGGASAEASNLIALAQRLHDEHIANGEQKRSELIAAAEVSAREIEEQAEQRKNTLEAELTQERTKLEEQKAALEAKIDELKSFERDYRLKLRGYIESQLRDLDRSSSLAFGGQNSSN